MQIKCDHPTSCLIPDERGSVGSFGQAAKEQSYELPDTVRHCSYDACTFWLFELDLDIASSDPNCWSSFLRTDLPRMVRI